EVWREAVQPILYTRPLPEDIPMIFKARSDGWLKLRDVEAADALALRDELLAKGLAVGESNSIALAKELNTIHLANDEPAILAARELGIETRWFTEILHDALKAGHIKSVEDYTNLLNVCIAKGLYVSRKAREEAIHIANEIVSKSQ
ncbi:MAG: hypothetical protein ACE5KU_00215, partial [Nitrososphaerales archaeon]